MHPKSVSYTTARYATYSSLFLKSKIAFMSTFRITDQKIFFPTLVQFDELYPIMQ